ncbi:DUF1648 domain-containing protein [Leucobacter musarum]|uniref:DUF1648 domain-containing protein n=1 Tax=Leucobacter musarum TaxID=1930747 RepID=UPI0006A7DD52|nr:DUF1648 domain-containing protein [Leucobacter musarum]
MNFAHDPNSLASEDAADPAAFRVGQATGWVRRLAYLSAVIAVGNVATHLHRLPQEMPTHFGITGEPDAWGPPGAAIAGIVLISTLAAVFAWLSTRRVPLNLPFPIHEGNEARIRRTAGQMLAQIAFAAGLLAVSMSYAALQLWNTSALTLGAVALMGGSVTVGMIRLFAQGSR